MRTFANILRAAVAASAIFGAIGAAHAEVKLSANDKNQMNRCAGYMLTGPSYEALDFKGEGWDCHQVSAKIAYDHLVVTGQLSHRLKLRWDDEVNFTLEFARDGTVVKSEVKIQNGGVTRALDWIKDNKFASYIVDKIPYGSTGLDAADWVADKASGKINDGWSGYSDLIVLTVATKISYGLAHVGKVNVESYFIDRPGGDLAKATFKKGGTFYGVTIDDKKPYSWTDACQAMCRGTKDCKASTFITSTKVCIVKSGSAGAATLYDRGVTTDNPYGAAVVRDHRGD